jgi:N-acetylmuramoyl-L-alanine amidase
VTAQTICIDPGHSKQTVGTTGKKVAEYKICWTVGVQLKAALEKAGYTAILTKQNANQNVTNQKRAEIANDAKSALFIRLHCDADNDHGFATFYPAKQGKIRGKVGPSQVIIGQSRTAAEKFHKATIKALSGALKDRGVRTDMQTAVGRKLGGALEGSIYAEVPVILLEMCVLKNRKDEAFIASKAGQAKLVSAIVAGIRASAPRTER